MDMTAHVAGAPVEELLLPFLLTGSTMLLLTARVAISRWYRPPPRHRR
jgi:hypothetical protein